MFELTECQNRNPFSCFHPVVNFIYFALVLFFSMTITHPVFQIISLVCSVICAISFNGLKGFLFFMKYSLPVVIITAVINPAFNHAGCTILNYLPSGNPLTLESILYGLSSGCILGTVLIWFYCFNLVFTSDKFIYLFGKIIPSLSLLLSMILRFIPKFKSQLKKTSNAQLSISKTTDDQGILKKLKYAVKVFSITVTWSLENAVDTADSMKARGYGLKGRTSFSIYKWEERDKSTLIWLIFCCFSVVSGLFSGLFFWRYLPVVTGASVKPLSVFIEAVFLLLCLTPVIINIREEIIWKKLKLKS